MLVGNATYLVRIFVIPECMKNFRLPPTKVVAKYFLVCVEMEIRSVSEFECVGWFVGNGGFDGPDIDAAVALMNDNLLSLFETESRVWYWRGDR